MPRTNDRRAVVALFAAVLGLLAAQRVFAGRCGSQNPPLCGLDSQTDPPDPLLGGTGGCTESSLATVPLFEGTGMCRRGWTPVIYDLAQPFPDNGLPADQEKVGSQSFVWIRAGENSPCAHMVDSVDPKPCPDPQLCPEPTAPQPEGVIKAPITGWAVACWSPVDRNGCRDMAIHTKSMCLHIGHERLGPGCTVKNGLDCANVSTEQIGVPVPGAKNRRLCPPNDPATSCRGTRNNGDEKYRVWLGAVCTTNNCGNPGVAPVVDPQTTCEVQWGATKIGYNIAPFRGINEPGWYDWKTGAIRMTLSRGKPTCGNLGVCLGERTGTNWELALVFVPRSGQNVPCSGATGCDAPACFGAAPTTTTTTPP